MTKNTTDLSKMHYMDNARITEVELEWESMVRGHSSAYAIYAKVNGKVATDEELNYINSNMSDVIYEAAQKDLY